MEETVFLGRKRLQPFRLPIHPQGICPSNPHGSTRAVHRPEGSYRYPETATPHAQRHANPLPRHPSPSRAPCPFEPLQRVPLGVPPFRLQAGMGVSVWRHTAATAATDQAFLASTRPACAL